MLHKRRYEISCQCPFCLTKTLLKSRVPEEASWGRLVSQLFLLLSTYLVRHCLFSLDVGLLAVISQQVNVIIFSKSQYSYFSFDSAIYMYSKNNCCTNMIY
jgi:hypothetical protein